MYRIIVETEVLEFGYRCKGNNYHVVATMATEPSQELANYIGEQWLDSTLESERKAADARAERGDDGEEWVVEMYVRTHIVRPGCLTPAEAIMQEMHDWEAACLRREAERVARQQQAAIDWINEQMDLLEHEMNGERLRW